MILQIDGHSFGYELQRVTQMFFPGEKVTVETVEEGDFSAGVCTGSSAETGGSADARGEIYVCSAGAEQECPGGDYVYAGVCGNVMTVRAEFGGKRGEMSGNAQAPDGSGSEMRLGTLLFRLLSEMTGIRPPWGVLTGIRPVKLLLAKLGSDDTTALERHFVDELLVSHERFSLALETAQIERPILARSTVDSFSLYVSIPFCPTRCAYCSFVSHSVERAAKLIPDYVDRLCDELRFTAEIVRELGLKLRTVYFGGGTPTTLTAEQLRRVMGVIAERFDLSGVWEYTVEAGRPDTVTREKLMVIRDAGARRISINPQTLSDSVLRQIGRAHTTKQTFEAYALAREVGFDAINADIIAGLPTDTAEGFRATVDGVIALAPENITVHTLTVKRASALSFEQARAELELVDDMVGYARSTLGSGGWRPYYLYRQNGTLGSLENVGYAKAGAEGLYNVYIMDETHSILAVGAGASTKLINSATGAVKRSFNYKYPYEYIEGFDEAKKRKEIARSFYAGDL